MARMVRFGLLRRIPIRFAIASLLLAGACLSAAGAGSPTVVLISLDGTPPEAVGVASLKTLAELARRGALAERLRPVFPTNTFPNHVTLVTGVAPERHGIVNNVFLDPERGLFQKSGDPSWIETEPLWSLAAQHGIVSASYHWVGSEGPWRSGRGPRYWKSFDASTSEDEKVEQILAWLALEPEGERPRLITAWFRGADAAGHHFGPGTPEVWRDLELQDAALGRLVAGLDARRAFGSTTLLVVSDHGMAKVERSVDLDAAFRGSGLPARVWGAGGFATVTATGGEGVLERVLAVARALGLEAHRRAEAPEELRTRHPRFGDVVVLAPPGVALARSGGGRPPLRGAHGYRPDHPRMGALFVASGGEVPPGTRLAELRAVDVAPTVLALLGAPVPEWMEGRPISALLGRPGGARAVGALEEQR